MTMVIERQVLAGVRFVDVLSRRVVERPLELRAADLKFLRSRSWTYGAVSAGLANPASAGFDLDEYFPSLPPSPNPPGWVDPLPRSILRTVYVADPSGTYQSRRFDLSLPGRTDDLTQADSIFSVDEIALVPRRVTDLGPGLATLRAMVLVTNPDSAAVATRPFVPVPRAVVRVHRASDDALLAFGVSAFSTSVRRERTEGEVLVGVPELRRFAPATTVDDDTPVIAGSVAARVSVVLAPVEQGLDHDHPHLTPLLAAAATPVRQDPAVPGSAVPFLPVDLSPGTPVVIPSGDRLVVQPP